MTTGPYNRDLQAKVGEPYVERWVRLTASIDIPKESGSDAGAKRWADDELHIVCKNLGWDCEITDSKILEDE